MLSKLWSGILAGGLAATAVWAIPTIEIKGSKFFTSDGDQYFIKGIAYQLIPEDPLVDTAQCKRDAALMQDLGANAIRVYHVNPARDHVGCMSTFADAGIYLFVDLDTFDTQINELKPMWNKSQFDQFAAVMDEFQQFDNTAGFFVGNEVLTQPKGSVAAPYVKAAARDMKAYRDSKAYRNIPVGYSAADIATLRPMLQNYLACGPNTSESIDFYALNAYEWCGNVDYQTSGYVHLNANVSDYSIPIFFSETGCIMPRPRTFEDQTAIFGPDMVDAWSGSIIYEWIEEANDYGLISYGAKVDPATAGPQFPDGYTRSGTPTPISPDFPNLSSQWATLSPSGTPAAAYKPALTPPPCPDYTEGAWLVNGEVGLPTLGQKFNSAVRSSITAGLPATTAGAAAASSSGAASPARELAGAGLGLLGVLAGAACL